MKQNPESFSNREEESRDTPRQSDLELGTAGTLMELKRRLALQPKQELTSEGEEHGGSFDDAMIGDPAPDLKEVLQRIEKS